METCYDEVPYHLSEMAHRYGPEIHILGHPVLLSLLARACTPAVEPPEFTRLIRSLYRDLALEVANAEFPAIRRNLPTRMRKMHREGVYSGRIIHPETRVVCVDIARAGMVPSQACFETFCEFLSSRHVRQDHMFANRRTDRKGKVVATDLSGSKVGGRIEGSILVIPDPMGATGGSLSRVLDHYAALHIGRPLKVIALHLIVTPEYLARVRRDHPGLVVYAVRLDRGLSSKAILKTVPGTHWKEERGLNDVQYIVPGGGGFGELLSNAER